MRILRRQKSPPILEPRMLANPILISSTYIPQNYFSTYFTNLKHFSRITPTKYTKYIFLTNLTI